MFVSTRKDERVYAVVDANGDHRADAVYKVADSMTRDGSCGPNPGGLTASQWAQVDDAVGACTGGLTEIQDDVFLFAVFTTALAPTPRDFSDRISVERGEPFFTQTGCANCHVTTTFRTPANPPPVSIGDAGDFIRVPGNFDFNPYSDFLKHDMGALGDRIGEAPPDDPAQGMGDTVASTRMMRTAPLWGIRFRNRLLHEGRCSDIACAIQAHAGQGAAARNAFNQLSSANRHNLVQFVRSLRAPGSGLPRTPASRSRPLDFE